MKNKKILSTSLSLGLSLALLIGNVSGNMNNVKATDLYDSGIFRKSARENFGEIW